MAGMLQRGVTIAGLTSAVVLGGTGFALAATTHDVTDPSAPVGQTVTTTVDGLAPTPQPQLPPLPGQDKVTSTVRSVTQPVVKTVTSTLGGPSAPSAPPVATAPAPKVGKPTIRPHTPASSGHRATQANVPSAHVRLLAGVGRANDPSLASAPELAVTEQAERAASPQLAPTATGPLADLPAPLRHAVPAALVVIAASILGALAVGHLGLRWGPQAAAAA